MAEKLAQTENMRRQLIGDVTHELRTPLTTIKGSIEGLIDGVLPPGAGTFQQIYREADRLTLLVDDLQELSRVEAGAYSPNQPVHMADLVAVTVARLGRQFEEKGVVLEIEIPPELPRVLADEALVFPLNISKTCSPAFIGWTNRARGPEAVVVLV